MQPRLFAGVIALAALLVSPDIPAATKMRDGFASMVITDGTSLLPRNPITRARGGDDLYYWIQWQEPIPRSTLRCVIKGPDTDIDETENFLEPEPKGYSVCGVETEDSDSGTLHFAQYLNGELVGEKSITLEPVPWFKGGIRKKWKWMMGGLALIIIAGYWLRRKMTGDKRSFAQVIGGESQAARDVRQTIETGSRVSGGAHSSAAGVAARADEAQDLRKLGLQFQALITQADKTKGLEIGRRYLGMLLKERKDSEAVKVFKECIAADAAFRLAQAEEVLPMAKAARGAGEPKAAVAALRGFDKAHPGHSLIPEVFVFSAKLLAEDLGNTDMARKILQHVLEKYPGHYIAQEAKRYLQAMPQPT